MGKILEVLSGGKWEFVWAQQWFTMTDQLNMGVRHLMLDPVYFWDAMRLCHCGTTFKWFDDVLDFLEKVRCDPWPHCCMGCLYVVSLSAQVSSSEIIACLTI